MYIIAFKCEKVFLFGTFSLLFTVGRQKTACLLFLQPPRKILTVYVGVRGLWDVFLIPFLANNRLVAVDCIQYVDFHVYVLTKLYQCQNILRVLDL